MTLFLLSFVFGAINLNSQTNSEQYKKSIGMHISLPHINNFSLKPPDEQVRKLNTGFWGLEIGFEYFYKSKSFLSLSGSANSNFFVPIPASPGIDGEYEIMSTIYLAILNNTIFDKFTFSYGLTYGKNTWSLRNNGDITGMQSREPVTESYPTLGLQTQIAYNLKKKFYIGLIYRPTFIRINNINEYEHLISLTLGKRINGNS